MIYGDVKPIQQIYCVETNDGFFHVSAAVCLIDKELKTVCFYDKNSIQAMFRLDDVKAFWRIL